jgi:hypothetical protein
MLTSGCDSFGMCFITGCEIHINVLSLHYVKQIKPHIMKTVFFIIEGENIVKVINRSVMSSEEVNHLIRTFMDLGWIVTEVKTVGYFQLNEEESSLHIRMKLTEGDGNVETYEVDESNFSELLEPCEVVERKPMGFVGMSNVSRA